MKKLFVFAHRLEALSFLDDENVEILITGEGIIKALSETLLYLASPKGREITEIINLGVCGTLRPDECPVGSIHPVRTVYRAAAEKMDFHSYTLEKSGIDIVTSEFRVVEKSQRDSLKVFAPLVDKELWGVAYAAQKFHLPLKSYKLVVDEASYESQENLCQMVKSLAATYSEQLHQFIFPSTDLFYFTHSEKLQWEKYQAKFGEVPSSLYDDLISDEKLSRKERTRLVLKRLKELAEPVQTQAMRRLEAIVSPLKAAKIQVNFPHGLEKPAMNLQMKIQSEAEFLQAKTALENFSFLSLEKGIDDERLLQDLRSGEDRDQRGH